MLNSYLTRKLNQAEPTFPLLKESKGRHAVPQKKRRVKSKFDKKKAEKKQLQKWTKTKNCFLPEFFLNKSKIHVDFDL
jgi:hypothetical protein